MLNWKIINGEVEIPIYVSDSPYVTHLSFRDPPKSYKIVNEGLGAEFYSNKQGDLVQFFYDKRAKTLTYLIPIIEKL